MRVEGDICHGAGCIRSEGEEMIEVCQFCHKPILEDDGCSCLRDDYNDDDL